MSHFTHIKTCFQNLFYLEKALNKLNISHNREQITNSNSDLSHINLILPQSNNHNIKFCWNGQEYELVTDMSFWTKNDNTESFIDIIAQQYAGEVIVGESQKIGFQPIKSKQNSDRSNTLILERWNNPR